MGPPGSQDLRSTSPIMAPKYVYIFQPTRSKSCVMHLHNPEIQNALVSNEARYGAVKL